MTARDPSPPYDAAPWCTVCGGPATKVADTLDPRRPIVVCRRSVTATAVYCGRVVGTTIFDEAHAAYVARRWKLTTAQHHRHDAERNLVPFCRTCQALPMALPGVLT